MSASNALIDRTYRSQRKRIVFGAALLGAAILAYLQRDYPMQGEVRFVCSTEEWHQAVERIDIEGLHQRLLRYDFVFPIFLASLAALTYAGARGNKDPDRFDRAVFWVAGLAVVLDWTENVFMLAAGRAPPDLAVCAFSAVSIAMFAAFGFVGLVGLAAWAVRFWDAI